MISPVFCNLHFDFVFVWGCLDLASLLFWGTLGLGDLRWFDSFGLDTVFGLL